MKLAATIAWTHLVSRKRQTIVSLLGVVLGVAFFLGVSSLMRGSEADFIRRLVDNTPHITVSDEYRNPRPQPAEIHYGPTAAVAISNVKPRTEVRGIRGFEQKQAFIDALPGVRVAPVLYGTAIMTFAGRDVGVSMSGVVPGLMQDVSTIETYMKVGTLNSLSVNPNGVIIGTGLAEKLSVDIGDNLTVASNQGAVRTMKIVGLFRTGNNSYDEGQAFILLKRMQSLMNRPNRINRFIVQMETPLIARATATRIENAIGYKAVSWQEASEDIMSVLTIRNIIMYSVVAAILVVASFGIYNVISTVVMEKRRDIAILKSMGFTAADIRSIFLIEGAILGVIGSAAGAALGLAIMYGLGQVTIKPPGAGDAIALPTYWGWDQIAIAIAFAMTSSIGAAYLPARKAGRVHPVDILRGAA
jgi:lipoprotein-releasing system permease protein